MSDFSVYTKEEQLENVVESAVDHGCLVDHLDIILNLLKHNLMKSLEKAFDFTIQGKKV